MQKRTIETPHHVNVNALNNLTINLTKLRSFSSSGIAGIYSFHKLFELFTVMSNHHYEINQLIILFLVEFIMVQKNQLSTYRFFVKFLIFFQ